MANYYGTTASNGGKIKKGKKKALENYLKGWTCPAEFSDLIHIEGDTLQIYGEDDFNPCPIVTPERAKEDEYLEVGEADYDMADAEGFLSGLAPFLEPKGGKGNKNLIVVQSVGNEKCRFPLGAGEWILRPNGEVEFNGFKGY